ncbi:hypothetical protein [Phenylobacterium sp.]|uniref:hypothetical protein n=1 Tax=Phenylobacterium sp. TaxID=1871053 RepID=UPI0035648D96
MYAEPWAERASRRTAAISASVAAHVLVLLFLIWRLGVTPTPAETPVMNVELTRLRPQAPKPPPEPRRERPATGSHAAPPIVDHPPAAAPDAREEARPAAEPSNGQGEGVRPALRGLLGCEPTALVGQSAEERRRCQDRLGADALRAQRQAAARLNLDPTGRYVTDPMPYLGRLPHNGCKVRAAGDVGPMGHEGAAAGVQCALSF